MFLLTVCPYWAAHVIQVKLLKKNLILEKNQMKEMKENISMDKLNISNLHKTIIPRIKHTETLKNRSSIYL